VGTLGVKVRVGRGVLVGAGVSEGSGVWVGRLGVAVNGMGVSVGVSPEGKLQEDTITNKTKLNDKNLYFILSP